VYPFTLFSARPRPIHQLRNLSIDSRVRVVSVVPSILRLLVTLLYDRQRPCERRVKEVLERNKLFLCERGQVPRNWLPVWDWVDELDVRYFASLQALVIGDVVPEDHELTEVNSNPSPAVL
jgi:hypothetical protein